MPHPTMLGIESWCWCCGTSLRYGSDGIPLVQTQALHAASRSSGRITMLALAPGASPLGQTASRRAPPASWMTLCTLASSAISVLFTPARGRHLMVPTVAISSRVRATMFTSREFSRFHQAPACCTPANSGCVALSRGRASLTGGSIARPRQLVQLASNAATAMSPRLRPYVLEVAGDEAEPEL
ncbi:MAG: hypothetical protein QOE58_1160, partial [Actinomycetota bacterium]|nr:hypothetical protein [Actinomycetota bacterium]